MKTISALFLAPLALALVASAARAAPLETSLQDAVQSCLDVVVKDQRDAFGPDPTHDLKNDTSRGRIYSLKIDGETWKLTLKEDLSGKAFASVSCAFERDFDTLDDALALRPEAVAPLTQAEFIAEPRDAFGHDYFHLCTATAGYYADLKWHEMTGRQKISLWARPIGPGETCPF